MLKREARALYRTKRDEITTLQKLKWDDLLLIQFQKLPLPPITSVLSFVPIDGKNEVDTFLITDYLQFKNPGLQVAYPKTDLQQQTMQAIALEEETIFEENEYRIAEPVNGIVLEAATLDVVLIPMLIFDESGNRIGYGKGFYDRFLKDCSDECMKVGLCYFDAIDHIDDTNEYDVPLDYCITPNKVYVF